MFHFKQKEKTMTDAQIRKIVKNNSIGNISKAVDNSLTRINSILCRKDIVNVENERLDAVRLLAYYLETSGKEMKSKDLIKFLKG